MVGQLIFNALIITLGVLSELLPGFKDWWDNSRWRDLVFLGGCFAVGGLLLFVCWAGVAVENCSKPIWWDDVGAAANAAIDAFVLFLAAQMFARLGRQGVHAVRAKLAS